MATEKQLKANRANARKSTGPRSMEGKTMASKNSLKHGLLSQEIILQNEDEVSSFLDITLSCLFITTFRIYNKDSKNERR